MSEDSTACNEISYGLPRAAYRGSVFPFLVIELHADFSAEKLCGLDKFHLILKSKTSEALSKSWK